MPDFPLTDENRMIQQLVRRFVKEELMPLERELLGGPLGARGAFGEDGALAPEKYRELIEKLRAIGLWGIDLPEEYGGNPISEMSKALLYEELAKTIVPLGIPPDAPNFHMLRELTEGNEYQENEYFWPYVRGEKTSCFILTEPNAGSDAQQIETSAVRDGDNWVINGTKVFISNADRADFGILMAVTDREKRARGGFTSFLVDLQDRTPGVKLARPIYTIAGGHVWEIVFDNVVLPDRQRLGPVGGGFAPMQRRLGVRRLQIGSRCVGMAERCLDEATNYSKIRVTFGQPLAQRQAIQWMLADSAIDIYATRLMTYNTIWKFEQGEDIRSEISMVKVFATEMATRVADRAIQIHGGLGLTTDLPLERIYRGLRIMRIVEGASEVHRMVVARRLLA